MACSRGRACVENLCVYLKDEGFPQQVTEPFDFILIFRILEIEQSCTGAHNDENQDPIGSIPLLGVIEIEGDKGYYWPYQAERGNHLLLLWTWIECPL